MRDVDIGPRCGRHTVTGIAIIRRRGMSTGFTSGDGTIMAAHTSTNDLIMI
jgi:hypothetical protein